jgi:hypothetical protein
MRVCELREATKTGLSKYASALQKHGVYSNRHGAQGHQIRSNLSPNPTAKLWPQQSESAVTVQLSAQKPSQRAGCS